MKANPFLEEAVIPTRAVLEGHYENVTANAHMVHLFNIPALLSVFGERIAELIRTDVDTYFRGIKTRPNINQIAYPEYNLGLAELGNLLSASFPASGSVPISRYILDHKLSSAIRFGPVLLLLDDAMYSGNTVFEMLDLVESSGAEHVLVYIVLTRGPRTLTNRIRKLRQYGRARVTVREVANVEMPVFKRTNCPACALIHVLDDVNAHLDQESALRHEVIQDLAALTSREPELAFREASAAQAATQSQYQHVAERVRLRWILEKSLEPESLSDRHFVARIVREYRENPASTLRLFEVLARERVLFLQNAELRKTLFYPTFASEIGPAAMHFAGQLESLSDIEAEGVHAVLAAFDPVAYLNVLPNLLQTALARERLCWLLLRQCFLTPEIRQWPSRVVRALTQGPIGHSSDCARLIDDAIKLWQRRKESRSKSPVLEYMRLTGPEVHNLGKAAKKLVVDIRQDSIDLARDWPHVREALKIFLADLSRLFRGLPRDSDVEDLKARTQELGLNLQDSEEIFRQTAASGISALDPELKNLLAKKFEQIESLIDSTIKPFGIRTLLEAFRTNVLTGPLAEAIQSHTPRLQAEGIEVQSEFSAIAPLAFGLPFDLFVAFENILDNVLKSGAKRLLIFVEVLPDNQRVHVRFLDNGLGVDPDVTFHHGLQYVQSITSAYGGGFELRACSATDPETFRAYNTVACVTFAHLPELR